MNISYLSPSFFFALPLISVPLIIHLLLKRHAKQVQFSDIRFIKQAVSKIIRIQKLKEILLLILRTSLIFLIIFLFSKPVIHLGGILPDKDTPLVSVIFIDNSYSMGTIDAEGKNRFDIAKQITKKIIKDKMTKYDRTSLFLISDKIEPVIPEFSSNKHELISELEKCKLSDRLTDLMLALNSGYKMLLNSSSINKQIIILTDMASHGFSEIDENKIENFDKKVKLIFIDVTKKEISNRFISNLSYPKAFVDEECRIKYTIFSGALKQKESKFAASLYVNDKKVNQAFIEENKKSIGKAEGEEFIHTFTEPGEYNCKIMLTPSDNLAIDDIFYFKIICREKIKILAVDGDPSISPYRSETFYVKSALTVKGMPAESSFCNLVNFSNFNLEKFDVLILCNVENLEKERLNDILKFLKKQKGLIFFLGDKVDIDFYNNELYQYKLLPAKLIRAEELSKETNILSAKFEGAFNSAIFKKYYITIPTDGSNILMKFANESPFLIELENKGKILMFTSTADRDWNNLAVKPSFLPLIHQVINYITENKGLVEAERHNRFSLNTKTHESILTKINESKLYKLFPNLPVIILKNTKDIEEKFISILRGKEVSKNISYLLLVLFLFESFLTLKTYKKMPTKVS